MIEIHARQVVLDDRRNLQEVIESIIARIDSMETVEEITEEGEEENG